MPYKIIHDHPDCPKESGETGMDQVGGHAVVKETIHLWDVIKHIKVLRIK